jgi:hypothetical protein
VRDPARIPEILRLLEEWWERPENADQRLGQLLVNLLRAEYSGDVMVDELFNVEDDKLYDWIDAKLDEPLRTRSPSSHAKPPKIFLPSGYTWIPSSGKISFGPSRVPKTTGPSPAELRIMRKHGKMLDHQKKRTKKGRGR